MDLIDRSNPSDARPSHAPALRIALRVCVFITLATFYFWIHEGFASPFSLLVESGEFAKQAPTFSKFAPVIAPNGTWKLPNSQFTEHILSLVDYYEAKQRHMFECCSDSVLRVTASSSLPHPQLQAEGHIAGPLRSALEKWVFNDKSRALPCGSVNICFSSGDKIDIGVESHLGSFGNSASGGESLHSNLRMPCFFFGRMDIFLISHLRWLLQNTCVFVPQLPIGTSTTC